MSCCSELLLYAVGRGLIDSWRFSRAGAGPIVEAVYHFVHIAFNSACNCSCCLIAALFNVDVLRPCVVCGDFIEDTQAGIQAFTIGFVCLDKEIIDYEAESG